ncbi:hypothetical protein ADL26_04905, partial [Thermoactinomyces vulgaris]
PRDGLAAQERGGEPFGVVEEFGRGPALLAHAAAAGRGGDLAFRVLLQPHAALERAVRAVGVGGAEDGEGGANGHVASVTGRRFGVT